MHEGQKQWHTLDGRLNHQRWLIGFHLEEEPKVGAMPKPQYDASKKARTEWHPNATTTQEVKTTPHITKAFAKNLDTVTININQEGQVAHEEPSYAVVKMTQHVCWVPMHVKQNKNQYITSNHNFCWKIMLMLKMLEEDRK
jgi:hypothetical protein